MGLRIALRRGAMNPPSLLVVTSGLLALTSGCFFSSYDPGALVASAAGDPSTRVMALGCLDVALRSSSDVQVEPSHPVLRVALGNRCPHAVPVRFSQMRVVGRYDEGPVPLALRDPRGEVHDAMLDGHAQATESFEFEPLGPRDALPRALCVTLTGLTDAQLTDAAATRCVSYGEVTL